MIFKLNEIYCVSINQREKSQQSDLESAAVYKNNNTVNGNHSIFLVWLNTVPSSPFLGRLLKSVTTTVSPDNGAGKFKAPFS